MSASTLTHTSNTEARYGSGSSAAAKGCSCGGAGCAACQTQGYVRPRFFAGQLLTEEDLQALSDYVAVKNRLHSRHFMGDGVVCGLQVTCHPCGGGKIVVQPGHALDCCGNDIVLECPVELDVNALVRDLRRNLLGGYDCGDPCADGGKTPSKSADTGSSREKKTDEGPRHYCLYATYSEEAMDPVAPYATDEPCGTSACEYSRVREGLRFELRCRTEQRPPPDFIQRVIACIGDLTSAVRVSGKVNQASSSGGDDPESQSRAFAEAKEALLDRLDRSPQLTDCALRAEVAAIPVPSAEQIEKEPEQAGAAAQRLVRVYIRMLENCICDALLPACPPCDETGVLLACLEVRDCQVVDICNLERRFVLTAPNFRYWFPVYAFGDLLERFCCVGIKRGRTAEDIAKSSLVRPTTAADRTADAAAGAGISEPDTAPPASRADDFGILVDMAVSRLLTTLGLTDRDGAQLVQIAQDIGEMAGRGAFDDFLTVRLLRRSAPSGKDVRESLSRQMMESDALKKAVHEAASARIEASVKEATARLEAKHATETEKLEKSLRSVQSRLTKLEGKG
jgi:hypothetical protein